MSRISRSIRYQSLLAVVVIVSLFTLPSAQAQDDTTWSWRKGNDPDSVRRTRAELDSLLRLHSLWMRDSSLGQTLDLTDTNFLRAVEAAVLSRKGADLERAVLRKANLTGAYLVSANLRGANLVSANLRGAYIDVAVLEGAFLRGANLQGASFFGADLSGAELEGTILDSAKMNGAFVNDAIFEPISLPDIPSIAQAYGLKQMRYYDNPTALTQLREEFSELGFKQQERDIICALRRHNPHFLETYFFDWTSEYGSNLSRPWEIFIAIWVFCGLMYYLSALLCGRSGVMLVLSGTTVDADHWCTYNAEDVSKLTDTSVQTLVNRKNSYLKDKHAMTFRWVPMFIRLIWWAFFFSSVSAFNIGFRDVNFGRWLRLLTRKEFDLKATGWVRVVSGFQALSSVYLVGLWILSFAGTPFK